MKNCGVDGYHPRSPRFFLVQVFNTGPATGDRGDSGFIDIYHLLGSFECLTNSLDMGSHPLRVFYLSVTAFLEIKSDGSAPMMGIYVIKLVPGMMG